MSFTNQKPFVATAADCAAGWSGGKNGKYFRCYLCGHQFIPGDTVRWVFAAHQHLGNFMVCVKCDGPDVLDRWVLHNQEFRQRFWWANRG